MQRFDEPEDDGLPQISESASEASESASEASEASAEATEARQERIRAAGARHNRLGGWLSGLIVAAAVVGGAAIVLTRGGASGDPASAVATPQLTRSAGAQRLPTSRTRPPSPAANQASELRRVWSGPQIGSAPSPDTVMAYLTGKWHISYNSPAPVGGGIIQEGGTGDPAHKKLRLTSIIGINPEGKLRRAYCAGQGSTVDARTDTTLRQYVYDCVAQVVTGAGWSPFKAWLDQKYGAGNTTGDDTVYRTPTMVAYFYESPTGTQVQLSGP